MQLVDAIEAWGRAHRSTFEDGEAEALADVWRSVKASDHATLDVASMTKDQARSVMSIFPSDQRGSVASTLNKVRKWTIAEAKAAADCEDGVGDPPPTVTNEPPGEPADGTVAIDGSGMVP